jgi:hypothetical protein
MATFVEPAPEADMPIEGANSFDVIFEASVAVTVMPPASAWMLLVVVASI